MIYDKVLSSNFHCALAFKKHRILLESSHKRNYSFFRSIATCKVHSCYRTFEIFIKDEPRGTDNIVFCILAVGNENHSKNENVARQLIGKDRFVVGEIANAAGPLRVFRPKVEDADEEMLHAGNFTGCESIEVLKQAPADYQKKFRLDDDIFRECRVRQEILEEIDVKSDKIKGYVQMMAEKPFLLHLTSEAQITRSIHYCAYNTYSYIQHDSFIFAHFYFE